MVWRAEDPQGNEAGKIRWEIVPYTRGKGLDIGCGPHKAFPHFIGCDSLKDVELFGIAMNPDKVIEDAGDLSAFSTESMDFVFSSHLLEHIQDYRAALAEWWRVIKTGGHLVLYLPHKRFYPNIGQPGSNPDHKHDFEPSDIKAALRDIAEGADIVECQERNEGMEYSFLLVVRKTVERGFANSYLTAKRPKKTACVVRYGGFGDMLQAACILPALKRQGYHVTMMTTPRGQSVIEHDPNVDAFYIQDDNQVPNHCLHDFWEWQAKRFDRFVNLSESIEGTLLAMPGRANHQWPHDIRHKYLDRNYHEWTAELAGVPFKPEGRFYATPGEKAKVSALFGDGRFNVVYALSGSSQHKFYAGMDAVIAQILLSAPKATIYLTGDEACKILEAGWDNEARVVKLSGEQSIRETLAMAQMAHCVVGPETGVLNAVGFDEGVRKVCLLSHSSHENLTKHWVNSFPVTPVGVDCYPCHRLHYGMKFCREDAETGCAQCQMSIAPARVSAPIIEAYQAWEEETREAA